MLADNYPAHYQEEFKRLYAEHMRMQEDILRDLLGRWVSELEPELVIGPQQEIVGLTFAGQPLGLKPWILKP